MPRSNAIGVLVVALALVALLASESARAQSCPGVCQNSNTVSCSSGYESGLCPGASNFKCCPQPTPNCAGQCQDNSLPCSGTYASGDCPGAANIQCCQSAAPSTAQGIDVAVPISASTAKCFATSGYSWAVTRAWHSTGSFDSTAPSNLANFQAAGLNADVYLFPCVGDDAAGQVSSMISSLHNAGATWNVTWIDVETNPSTTCDWSSSDVNANCDYLNALIAAIQSAGQTAGVYSSTNIWSTYFGGASSCTTPAQNGSVPLWYPRYNGDSTCNAFTPFGGWTSAAWHQWVGDGTVCGTDVDENVACA